MITDKCKGCKKIVDGVCSVYNNPTAKLEIGGCYFAPKEGVNNVKTASKIRRTVKSKLFVTSKYRRRRSK